MILAVLHTISSSHFSSRRKVILVGTGGEMNNRPNEEQGYLVGKTM